MAQRLATLFIGLALLLPSPLRAAVAIDYSLYTLGDYVEKGGSRIGGGVAVAGDASINSVRIGDTLGDDAKGQAVVVVGGNIAFDNSRLPVGDVVYGGKDASGEYTRADTPGGRFVQGSPVDFDRINAEVLGLSARYGRMSATGVLDNRWGSATLTAGDKGGTDVFVLSTRDFEGIHALQLVGRAGSTAIINIFGDSFSQYFKFDRGEYAVADIVFNFVGAREIRLGGIELAGSILAPLATITQEGGRIEGRVVAGSYRSAGADIGGEGRMMLMAGEDPAGAVPEPGTWAMFITGFGLVGAMLRRRRPEVSA